MCVPHWRRVAKLSTQNYPVLHERCARIIGLVAAFLTRCSHISPRRTCDHFSPAPCVAVARSIFIIQFRSRLGLFFFLLCNFSAFHTTDCHQNHHTANATEHANCATSINFRIGRRRALCGFSVLTAGAPCGVPFLRHQGHQNLLAPRAPNLIGTKGTLRPPVALLSLVYWYCRSCGLAARGTPTATSPG